MNELELELLLKQAAEEARDLSLAQIPSESTFTHIFSDTFEENMQAMLSKMQPGKSAFCRKFLRRAASFLLVGTIALSSLVLGVNAWKEHMFEMVEQKHPDYSQIYYRSKDGSGVLPKDFQLTEKQPSYIPQGYLLTHQILGSSTNCSTYTNAQGEIIAYNQSVNAQEGFGMGLSINTEGAQLEPFELNGNQAYKMSNQGTQYILWNDDIYNYMILTALPMQQALQVAKSVQNVPADAYHPPQLTDVQPLTENYSPEQARENGDMIVLPDHTEQAQLVERLLKNAENKQADIIRITDFTGTSPVAKELYFDGFRFQYRQEQLAEFSSYGYEGQQIIREQSEDGQTILSLIDMQGQRIEICRYQDTAATKSENPFTQDNPASVHVS